MSHMTLQAQTHVRSIPWMMVGNRGRFPTTSRIMRMTNMTRMASKLKVLVRSTKNRLAPAPSPPLPQLGDLISKISSSQILRRLTEKNNAAVARRRRTVCLTSQRTRAAKRSNFRTTDADAVISLNKQWRLYLPTLDPLFFHECTLDDDCGRQEMGLQTGGRKFSTAELDPTLLRLRKNGAPRRFESTKKTTRMSPCFSRKSGLLKPCAGSL
jgi:hypothetical protein